MTTFIDSSGRLVRGSPPLTLGRALQLPAEFLWAVLGFVTLFFSSCFGVARAGQKTSASGGRVVRKGGPGGFGGGGGGRPSTVRGMGDYKPDPCAAGGG